MEAPKKLKQLCGFIGMVNYYRDMQLHRVQVLALLPTKMGATKKCNKQEKFVWTPVMQQAFDKMKALVAADVLCAYPNHNKLSTSTQMCQIISLVLASCKMTNL